MSISESAVLVKLSIGTWSAEKKSKHLSDELIAQKGGKNSDAAKVITNLMSGTRAAKDITDYAGICRLEHSTTTLPWEDRGFRALPTSLVLDYKTKINYNKERFWLMVEEFFRHYHVAVEHARVALGGLFDESQYPTLDQLKDKYHFDLYWSPIPQSGHFYVDIPAKDLEEMNESVDSLVEQRTGAAVTEAWQRLHKILASMSEKLGKDEEKVRWHDSFVTNAQDLCHMLTHLNITGDPKLEQARKQLEVAMGATSIEMIKESAAEREKVRDKVDAILDKFDW